MSTLIERIEAEAATAARPGQYARLTDIAAEVRELADRLEATEAKAAKVITISPIEWAECIREAQSRAWLEGHAAGRDYQGDGWNSDVHDPAEDNPYSAPQPADAPEGHGDADEAGEGL